MPVGLAPNNILQFTMEYADEAALQDTALNVLHYKITNINDNATGLPAAIEIDIENFMEAALPMFYLAAGGAWANFASEDVVLKGVSCQKIDPIPRSEPFHHTPDQVMSGIAVGDSLPMQDAMTVLKKTGYGERWGQGRVYVPGIPESQAEAGYLIPTGVTSLQPFANWLSFALQCNDGVYTTNLVPVIFSPARVIDDVTHPKRITQVTRTVLSDNIIKTQRRRRPGKGS
jgi:hypothetical protein